MTERFYGKYLGIVVDNDDPKGLARVRATVPEVFGEETTGWCLPCSPYSGSGTGLATVPPIDSQIYVEWPAGVVIRDTSGSEAIEIEAKSGAKITLDADGVLIEFGSQKVAVSRTSISLNDGALEVR